MRTASCSIALANDALPQCQDSAFIVQLLVLGTPSPSRRRQFTPPDYAILTTCTKVVMQLDRWAEKMAQPHAHETLSIWNGGLPLSFPPPMYMRRLEPSRAVHSCGVFPLLGLQPTIVRKRSAQFARKQPFAVSEDSHLAVVVTSSCRKSNGPSEMKI
jgi:hypothetical protein